MLFVEEDTVDQLAGSLHAGLICLKKLIQKSDKK